MLEDALWSLLHQALGESRNKELRSLYGSADPAIFIRGKMDDWKALLPAVPDKVWYELMDLRKTFDGERRSAWMEEEGIRLIAYEDPAYPEKLRAIYDPPALLYVKGRLRTDTLALGLVGSRKSTHYGMEVAEWLGYGLSTEDCVVVSGLARGIDGAAHRGALGGGGGTIGVLGTSIEKIYPREHRALYADILEHPNGAIVSSFPFNSPPLRHHFPRRNRIIAGLVDGLIVVEAAEVSGALITAGLAADSGRDVFAVPGSVFSDTSKGALRLIKDGAKMVTDVNDILEEYGQLSLFEEEALPPVDLSPEEKAILDALGSEPMLVDELSLRLKCEVSAVTATLSVLEINGLVNSLPGRQYVKRYNR